jgi:hypothetical protein
VSRPPHAGGPGELARARTTAEDAHLRGVRVLARLLDEAITIPGTNVKVGLDPIIGFLPGAGDVVGGALSAYALLVAARLGAPKTVMVRMLGNVAIDAVVGAVPVLGDLFDFGFKANTRNVALLEQHVAAPAGAERASRGFVVLLVVAALLVIAGMVALGVLIARFVWNAVMQ